MFLWLICLDKCDSIFQFRSFFVRFVRDQEYSMEWVVSSYRGAVFVIIHVSVIQTCALRNITGLGTFHLPGCLDITGKTPTTMQS